MSATGAHPVTGSVSTGGSPVDAGGAVPDVVGAGGGGVVTREGVVRPGGDMPVAEAAPVGDGTTGSCPGDGVRDGGSVATEVSGAVDGVGPVDVGVVDASGATPVGADGAVVVTLA